MSSRKMSDVDVTLIRFMAFTWKSESTLEQRHGGELPYVIWPSVIDNREGRITSIFEHNALEHGIVAKLWAHHGMQTTNVRIRVSPASTSTARKFSMCSRFT